MNRNLFVMGALVALALPALAADVDPKVGKRSYGAAGHVERAPDYAEVKITFSVSCLDSAEAVRKMLLAHSQPLFAAIQTKITKVSEEEQTFYSEPHGIYAQNRTQMRHPSIGPNGNPLPGKLKRVDTCTGKEVDVNAPGGVVYSGYQVLGVRSGDLDWVEKFAKSASQLPSTGKVGSVTVSAGAVNYDVTPATQKAMRAEVEAQALARATGAGSSFEAEKKIFQFVSNHPIRRTYGSARSDFASETGSPSEPGKPHRVKMNPKFTYTIYAETADPVRGAIGLNAEYLVEGRSEGDADYGTTSLTVASGCHATSEAAIRAIESVSSDIKKELESFHGTADETETDAIVLNNPPNSQAMGFGAFETVETDEGGNAKVLFDSCKGQTLAAPAGAESGVGSFSPRRPSTGLPEYWRGVQTFVVKSSDFKKLGSLVDSLRKKYEVPVTSPKAVRVAVEDVVGQATRETLQRLFDEANQDADRCLLAPDASLSRDASVLGYQCAHVVGIRSGDDSIGRDPRLESGRSRNGAAFLESAPGASADSAAVPARKIFKKGEHRPRLSEDAYVVFEYEIKTKDLSPLLKAPK